MIDERELALSQLVTNPVPDRVVIGCVPYRIVQVSGAAAASDNYRARMDPDAQVIWLREDLKPPFVADCLLHEILHGCYSHFGIREKQPEEYTVNTIASCLCAVLTANPKVARWIAWALGAIEET